MRICPSILNADRTNLKSEIAKIANQSDLLHLDVMDNVFVPNKTFDLNESEVIIKDSPIPVDVHLMITKPELTIGKYCDFGAKSVTFHFEATSEWDKCIDIAKSKSVRVGIALKPSTSFAEVSKYLDLIDMVLVMTVEPGFGGQAFMENMMPKVTEARREIDKKHLSKVWLEVDGGISLETINLAKNAGADTFVAGSAVFKDENPGLMVDKLRAAISS
jgi:ribulose-phosphate 3-epimerase